MNRTHLNKMRRGFTPYVANIYDESAVNQNVAQRSAGFTLVETIVSTFIFGIIVSIVGSTFIAMLMLQRRGSGAQRVQESSLFVLELMAREIRVSRIDNQDDITCTRNTLTVEHPVNGTVVYSISGGQVQRQAGSVTKTISSKDVIYNRLSFCVQGSAIIGGSGDLQPSRVTIISQVSSKAGRPQDIVTFDLATTVVSRDDALEFTTN